MTIATDLINEAIDENNGQINKAELQKLLDNSGIDPSQDWEEETTTWTFEDGSAIRANNMDFNAYGIMPNTNEEGWYFL